MADQSADYVRRLIGPNRYRRLFDGRWRIYRSNGEKPVPYGPALPLWLARAVAWTCWTIERHHTCYSLGRAQIDSSAGQ